MKFKRNMQKILNVVKEQVSSLIQQISQNHYKNFLIIIFWLLLLTFRTMPQFTHYVGLKDMAALLILAAVFIYNLSNALFLVAAAVSVALIPLAVGTNRLVIANLLSTIAILSLVIALFIVPLKNIFFSGKSEKSNNR